jgi:thiol:disulfide interchange protein DsbC
LNPYLFVGFFAARRARTRLDCIAAPVVGARVDRMKALAIAASSLLLLAACAGVSGEPTAPAPKAAAAGGSKSIEDVVREHVAAKVPGKVSSVRKLPFGMYEVVIENEIVYVDESANYLLTGHLYDTRSQEDLTAKRSDEVLRVDFASLPLQLAFKVVRGDGSRPIAIFEDPNCPYCKRLERDIRSLNNTTMYVFLYPILSDDSVAKSNEVWCSKDPADAWAKLMLDGRQPEKAAEGCKTPVDDVLALGHRLSVTGTPTLLFADGRRAPGVIPLDRIEQMMNTAAAGPQSKQPGPEARQN